MTGPLPTPVRWLTGDVFDRLAELDDDSVDLVVTSPPFLALRAYLPDDHPDKHLEIGTEATPGAFVETLLAVTAELRRVLAPHGSIAVELGDTYSGSGGGGGDFLGDTIVGRTPQQYADSTSSMRESNAAHWRLKAQQRDAWPETKCRALIPELYRIALAYGVNPLTGTSSPAGRWLIRNVITWCKPSPTPGQIGDKWRPATSDVVNFCLSPARFWDDLATRNAVDTLDELEQLTFDGFDSPERHGSPLRDYWVIQPDGFTGSHYATYPPELVAPFVKSQCPERVCRTCGEPSRRIVERSREVLGPLDARQDAAQIHGTGLALAYRSSRRHLGWTDCGHDDYRAGVVLDPFAGSGTTLAVAHGHGRAAIGIDLDARNAELARQRLGLFYDEATTATGAR